MVENGRVVQVVILDAPMCAHRRTTAGIHEPGASILRRACRESLCFVSQNCIFLMTFGILRVKVKRL